MTEWTEDGRPAAWVTETEPEFDPNERADWHDLDEYEQEVCAQCGNLRAICSDPMGLGEGFYPQRHVCWATAAREVATRAWHTKHENAKPDRAGFLPTDGTTIWVSPENLTPDDNFI